MLTFKRIIKSLDETEYNLKKHVKKCTIFLVNVLEFSKCDLGIDVHVIENENCYKIVVRHVSFF